MTDSSSLKAQAHLPSAGLLRRLAAFVYDAFLLAAIALAYAAAILMVRILTTDSAAAQIPFSGWAQVFYLLGLWLSLVLFYIWCWRRTGQTLGMKTWRLRLQSADTNELASWRQCWLRCLLAPVSMLSLGLGYLWCLGKTGQCWHDALSKTDVVVLPKP